MDRADGWFADVDPADADRVADAIREGAADAPDRWPDRAIEAGVVPDAETYYRSLRDGAIAAAEAELELYAHADDQHVKHAVRTLDDLVRVSNELHERRGDWAAVLDAVPAAARDELPIADRLADVEELIADMEATAETLRADLERLMHDVAPNLSAIAGPELGARLIATAGDLERLAKLPSGTVQVLGAEDALFAHLSDGAPPPKHGLIYTHEYVRGTHPEQRGSAARALAGKLSIAARIDHYAGDHRPELAAELRDRIERIRERTP